MSAIRVGIVGYGNLGRGVEYAISQNPDMELVAVFTRRDPSTVNVASNASVYLVDDAEKFQNDIDVMILCGGSATDLPEQGPHFAQWFNTIDSFDTHAKIPEFFDAVDAAAQKSGKVSVISVGWDPGLFSLNRLLGESVLPVGTTYTFWGDGLSQGHSDAVRRIEGVKNAVQYTLPIKEAVERVRNGENPELTTREKHARECWVVLEDGADATKVEQEIISFWQRLNSPSYCPKSFIFFRFATYSGMVVTFSSIVVSKIELSSLNSPPSKSDEPFAKMSSTEVILGISIASISFNKPVSS